MFTKSIAPRTPLNQGVDLNNKIVQSHNEIYDKILNSVPKGTKSVSTYMNPYGTAPLSGYLGIWTDAIDPVNIKISDDNGSIPVDYNYTPLVGANLIPLLGLVPGTVNRVTLTIDKPNPIVHVLEIATDPLPPTDQTIPTYSQGERFVGFPVIEVTTPPAAMPKVLDELYYIAFAARYIVGVDSTGTVRWYTSLDIPAFGLEKISNGHFVSASPEFEQSKHIYEFDMVGRVHKIFVLDNQCHHSIHQLPDGNLILPSEITGTSREDGISIIDFNTGLEIAYYDIRDVMDITRAPVPRTKPELDWIHINQAYVNDTNNLIVASGRHQGLFGFDVNTANLSFILANHQDWATDFHQYLLTPVDEAGNPLYDLSNPLDIDKADKEFWSWGQHAVIEVPNSNKGIVEILVLDNGNYRSRTETNALIANDNYSRMVQYRINLNDMTVRMMFEYGKDEVGNKGYSSYVSNAEILDNGNYLVNFGGIVVDENGRPRTTIDGLADIADPLSGKLVQGKVIIHEVDPGTKTVQLGFTCSSGRYKNKDEGKAFTVDLYSFRARKLILF